MCGAGNRPPALVRDGYDDGAPVDNAIDQVERKALERNFAVQRVQAPPNSGKLTYKRASSPMPEPYGAIGPRNALKRTS
jgi:hypothetical protein